MQRVVAICTLLLAIGGLVFVARRRSRRRGPRRKIEDLVERGEKQLAKLRSRAKRARGKASERLGAQLNEFESRQKDLRERLRHLREEAEALVG